MRVRTPATLTFATDTATGSVGGSAVAIRYPWSSDGTPVVSSPPIGDCSTGDFGSCADARFAVQELGLDVAGPSAGAIAVVDAYATSAATPDVELVSGTGYRGVSLARAGMRWLVLGSDAPDGAPGASLTYDAPAEPSEHVVVDAPTDAEGQSDVVATLEGAICHVTVSPHASGTPFDGRPLVFDLASSCAVSDPGTVPEDGGAGGQGAGGHGAGGSGTGGANGAPGAAADGDSGCGCRAVGTGPTTPAGLAALGALLGWIGRSWRWPRSRGRSTRRSSPR